jgi:hypothetical protein
MAISNRQELEAAVIEWMARSDIQPNIANCIALAEAYFNRRLRVRQMENVVEFTPVTGSVGLPLDYLAWRRLTWLGSPNRDLEYVVPSVLTRQFAANGAGVPAKFTIEGQYINLRPVDDATNVEFNYYARIDPLSADPTQGSDTNWLLLTYPDMYLAGTLAWVNTLVQNQEQFQQWIAACDQIIERAMQLSEKTKGPAAIQIAGQAW